jgi:hypothetical protein
MQAVSKDLKDEKEFGAEQPSGQIEGKTSQTLTCRKDLHTYKRKKTTVAKTECKWAGSR